jgi:hypothetical protein
VQARTPAISLPRAITRPAGFRVRNDRTETFLTRLDALDLPVLSPLGIFSRRARRPCIAESLSLTSILLAGQFRPEQTAESNTMHLEAPHRHFHLVDQEGCRWRDGGLGFGESDETSA